MTRQLIKLAFILSVAGAGFVTAPEAHAQAVCYMDEDGRIVTRRRPGYQEVPCPEAAAPADVEPGQAPVDEPVEEISDAARRADLALETRTTPERPPRTRNAVSPVPRPGLADYVQSVPVPDRWRIVESIGYTENLWDPYNRNVLKGDRPVHDDWFFNLGVISDSVVEIREVPTPVGSSTTGAPGEIDVFGSADQNVYVQNLLTEFVYYKGDTVFKPPDYEFRLTAAFNYNRVELEEVLGVNANPAKGLNRNDSFVGIQAAFFDKHLRNIGDRYDFDSFRIGIQPFSSDFRGFLFQDNQLGMRLFGTRNNNIFQYNLAWFRRLQKDTNSGLNDLGQSLRDDDVFIANLYWQDMPARGFVSQATVAYNRNREGDEFYFNKNSFIERPASFGRETPREYDVYYVGYSGDGHFGRLNVSTSLYYAFGDVSPGVFADANIDISAGFAALELSWDMDWIRPKLSFLYGSGDDDPFDDKATGFDAIFENPQFAGADTSYWIRQPVPLIGGGRVALSPRNGVLNSLRSSKEEGQSNFTNPGILLAGIGVDMDITPKFRWSLNLNSLWFDDTAVLEVARNQAPIDREIGYDLSTSIIYRPLMSQNIVVRASYAHLIPSDGFTALFPDEDAGYFLLNVVLAY
ncbi:MAG: hypothetical protein ACR2QR_07720 [Woeseiaceae bacterium]